MWAVRSCGTCLLWSTASAFCLLNAQSPPAPSAQASAVESVQVPSERGARGASPDSATPTLHVYVNRVQLPVLVLNMYGHPMPALGERAFHIGIEGMKPFTPLHARLEGDDPLAVSVLVDFSNRGETMWRDLPSAMERMMAAMNPQDQIVLYGWDGCKALRFLPESGPFQPAAVRVATAHAFEMGRSLEKHRDRRDCRPTMKKADLLSYIIGTMRSFPGRRLVVSVESGNDLSYGASLPALKQMVLATSTMVLPIVHNAGYAGAPLPLQPHLRGPDGDGLRHVDAFYGDLIDLSEYSGGFVQYIAANGFTGSLAAMVRLARGRYILEFARPEALQAGLHRILVTDGHTWDFIRASGITVPLGTPDEMGAPKLTRQAPSERF